MQTRVVSHTIYRARGHEESTAKTAALEKDLKPQTDPSYQPATAQTGETDSGSTVCGDGAPAGSEEKILDSINKAASRYDLPVALIRAVVKAESNYQVRAVSPAGAQGLMQLMPATARELGVEDPFDIDQNIQGGTQYLRNMLDQFNGNVRLALSAYNAGPGTVARYGGNVPYTETRDYVHRVLRYARQFSDAGV